MRSQAATRTIEWADGTAYKILIGGTALVIIAFWPWNWDPFVEPKFLLLRVVAAAAALFCARWVLSARPSIEINSADIAVAAFLVGNLVAFLASTNRSTSFVGEPLQRNGLITWTVLVAVYAVSRLVVRSESRLLGFAVAGLSAGSIVALYGLVQMLGWDPIWQPPADRRVFSTIGQPNWLASLLTLTIPLAALVAGSADRVSLRIISIGAGVLQALVLAATLSRGGYLGLGAGLILSMTALAAVGRKLSTMKLAAGLVVLVGTITLSVNLLSSRGPDAPPGLDVIDRATSAFDLSDFAAQRYFALWEVGLAIAADHPLWGAGQDTYAEQFPAYRDRVLDAALATHFSQFRPESPHNVYVSIASGAGFPTVIAYLAAVALVMVAIIRAVATGDAGIFELGLVAALVGHLVSNAFMTLELSGSALFWGLLGSMSGLYLADSRSRSPVGR